MSIAQRRSTQTQTVNKLLNFFPNVQKTFKYVDVVTPGDMDLGLKATYPVLTGKAYEHTMNGYRLYVMAYNQKVSDMNRDVRKQVALSKKWVANQPEDKIDTILRTQIGFSLKNTALSPAQYNEKVKAYNTMYGSPIIPMKKIQPIRPSTELVFETMLWEYGNQLLNYKTRRVKGNLCYPRSIYKIEINTKHLENTRGKHGIYKLSYCPDTILNHKKRLIEAGVLLNNRYKGSERGTEHHINPKILVLFDDYDQKFVCSENQLLRISKPEEFRDTVRLTRAINKQEIKKAVDNSTASDKDKCLRPLHNDCPTDSFTRAPKGKMERPELKNNKKIDNSAEKNGPVDNTSSTSNCFSKKIKEPTDFIKYLSENQEKDPENLEMDQLKWEATCGTMSKMDFRTLLIQDIFENFSKLYQDHPYLKFYFGEWLKTYHVWLNSRAFFNKNGHLLQKSTMLTHYIQVMYCINNAKWGASTWIKDGRFTPPTPFIYLNPENSTQGTFIHHFLKIQKKSPKAFKKIGEWLNVAKNEGKKAKVYDQYLKRLNRKFADFYNGKLTDDMLIKYVRDNMPLHIQNNFHKHLDNYRNNTFKMTS